MDIIILYMTKNCYKLARLSSSVFLALMCV